MGADVGYAFDRLQLEKSAYIPIAHSELEQQQRELLAAVREVFTGQRSLRMDVASFPSSPETAQAFKDMLAKVGNAFESGGVSVSVGQGKDQSAAS